MKPTTLFRPVPLVFLFGIAACTSAASAAPTSAAAPPSPSEAQAAAEGSEGSVDIKAIDAEIASTITVVSPTDRTITPRGAELLRGHGADLVGTFRHVAEKQNGALVGVRLFGIRPTSAASKLGLESGDRVESILGTPLDSPAHIAAAFEAVKGAQSVDITVSRRNVPLRLVTTVK